MTNMSTDSFDFIIVGGGTAGIALAARLSEIADQKVLVLEAGADHSDDPRVKIPAFYSALFGTDADWGFKTTVQEQLGGRSISINQGKALGGSSVINAHIFAPQAYTVIDDYARLGNVGWDWDTIAPYYTKAFTAPDTPEEHRQLLGVDSYSLADLGTGGPVKLSYPGDHWHPIRKIWAETFGRKGWPMTGNPWVNASVGGFSNLASIDPVTRERCHAAKAYYEPNRQRENLHVVLNAHVTKIIFSDGELQPKATGVQYNHEGQIKIANAGKEIIISAGALQSPKLLELSGIGNAEILRRHGIEVVKDLPGVGENLQDHIVCDITYTAEDKIGDTLDALARQEQDAMEEAMGDYIQKHEGILTSGGILTYAYLPLMDFQKDSGEQPLDITRDILSGSSSTPEEARAAKYSEIAWRTLVQRDRPSGAYLTALGQNPVALDPATGQPIPPQPGKHLIIATILAMPLSRGTVHIVSNDPAEKPEVDPKYLSHHLDVEVFARNVMFIESLARSEPLSDVLKQPLEPSTPLAHMTDLDAAKRYVQSRAISMWHPAGTCSMLPEEIRGVVDDHLRVHGVSNLRVVDASTVPLLPPGNLQSTIYALAERAADLIKEAHGLP
ncbi:oxidoreductase [Xylaria bambusicola]|uniref:oxidoreductase n=1 Tax=Xylaria bambusicola TaxID=326684 RepID=UPI002007F52A|nr:oxidoreductase [Xylaria bambusicola]KAI0518554.1 oxidoreductase [Xylaria bambusicola]